MVCCVLGGPVRLTRVVALVMLAAVWFVLVQHADAFKLEYLGYRAIPSGDRLNPPDSVEQPIEVSGLAGDFYFAQTYCRVFLCWGNFLHPTWKYYQPFFDCDDPDDAVNTNIYQTGSQLQSFHEGVDDQGIYLWIGLRNFSMVHIRVDSAAGDFDRGSAVWTHLQFDERAFFDYMWHYDQAPYPISEIRSLVVDARNYAWFLVGSPDIYYNGYRVYAADLNGVFKAGRIFRAIPQERVSTWAPLSYRQAVMSNWTVFAIHSQSVSAFRIEHLPPGEEIDDPYWPGEKRSYTVDEFSGGAGNTKEILFDETRKKVVEIGANQILTRYDGIRQLRLDDVHFFQLMGNHQNSELAHLCLDQFGYYTYLGDNYDWMYQVDMNTMTEPDHPVFDFSDPWPGFSIRFVSFLSQELKVCVQFGANAFAIFDTQDCSNATAYSTCEKCLQIGGQYCWWNASSHSCGVYASPHEPQKCPVLVGPLPPSVSTDGGTVIKVISEFDPSFDYKCQFYYNSSPGTPFATSNATLVNGGEAIMCETPQGHSIPAPDDLKVLVRVVGPGDFRYTTNGIQLAYHFCNASIDVCLSEETLVDCGVCMDTASCSRERFCEGGHWVPNGSPVPQAVLAYDSSPNDFQVDMIVLIEHARVNSSVSYECQWGTLGAPQYVSTATPVASDPLFRTLTCLTPIGAVGSFLELYVFADGEQFTYNDDAFLGHHKCASATCAHCLTSEKPFCQWCPYNFTCASHGCPGNAVAEGCPLITGVSPGEIATFVGVPLEIRVRDLPDVTVPGSLECLYEMPGVRITTAATIANHTVSCAGPVLHQDGTVDVKVLFDNSSVVARKFSFSAYDCHSILKCVDCAQFDRDCGWCLENATCMFYYECASNLTFIEDAEECPVVESVYPFQGAMSGGTMVNVTATGLFHSETGKFGCRFGESENMTVAAESMGPVHVSCLTPSFVKSGFLQVNVMLDDVVFTSNSISFVVFDCESSNASCSSCVVPRRAECGWCLNNNTCGSPLRCDKEFFVRECPTLLGESLHSVEAGMRGQVIRFYFSRMVNELPWQCVWGDGVAHSAGRPNVGGSFVECTVPEISTVGTMKVAVMYGDVQYAVATSDFSFSRPREKQAIEGGNWAGIICLLLCAFSMTVVFRMGFSVAWGRRTPVIRSASPFFCHQMLAGGFVGIIANMFFIWKPLRAVCIIRPWLSCLAHVLIFGSLYAKTYRIYRIFHNPKLRRIRLRKRTLLFWIHVFGFIDTVYLIIWSAADPMDAVWVPKGESYLVRRCKGKHTLVFQLILYIYKLLFVILGCVLAFLTRSVPSNFNESKYIGLSMYASVIVGLIGLPLVYFGGLPEEARVILLTLCILSLTIGTLCFVFVPKMWIIHLRKSKNVASTSRATQFASKAQRRYGKKSGGRKGKKGKGGGPGIGEKYYTPPPLTAADGRVLCTSVASLGDRTPSGQDGGEDYNRLVTSSSAMEDSVDGVEISEHDDMDEIAGKYGGGGGFELPSYLMGGDDDDAPDAAGELEPEPEPAAEPEQPAGESDLVDLTAPVDAEAASEPSLAHQEGVLLLNPE